MYLILLLPCVLLLGGLGDRRRQRYTYRTASPPEGFEDYFGDRLISVEQAAVLTETSVTIVERFVILGLVEPVGTMLRGQDLQRIIQIMRLRRDLGLNLAGAAMVLELAQENAMLRAQLQALRRHHNP